MIWQGLFALMLWAGTAASSGAETRPLRVHLDTLASADRSIRDIDAVAVTVSAPITGHAPFRFGFQGGLVATRGSSIEPGDLISSPADALGAFAGGYVRFGPHLEGPVTPFAEGGIALLIMDRSFPQHPLNGPQDGRLYGKFDIRWGVDVALSPDLALEAAFVLTHISNGSGFGPQNINYDGVGFSLGFARNW